MIRDDLLWTLRKPYLENPNSLSNPLISFPLCVHLVGKNHLWLRLPFLWVFAGCWQLNWSKIAALMLGFPYTKRGCGGDTSSPWFFFLLFQLNTSFLCPDSNIGLIGLTLPAIEVLPVWIRITYDTIKSCAITWLEKKK